MPSQHPSIAIVTDSTADVPVHLVERYGIHIVPLYVLWGDQQLRDGVDISRAEFYNRLQSDPNHPQTSQPTPADFRRVYEATGADQIVVITISSALSGTLESARKAAEMVSAEVYPVDSRSVSMGLGWQVLAAARARERGGSAEEMVQAVLQARSRLSVLFAVQTLDYLRRGGRIGGAAWLLGTALRLKPLLSIDVKTGLVDAAERIRTRSRCLERCLEFTLARLEQDTPTYVAVVHSAAREEAEAILERVLGQIDAVETYIAQLSPVLGVHGGPGIVGIAAYSE